MTKQVAEKPKVTDSLKKFKIDAEGDTFPKNYASPTAGIKQQRFVRTRKFVSRVASKVKTFLRAEATAIKVIVEKVM